VAEAAVDLAAAAVEVVDLVVAEGSEAVVVAQVVASVVERGPPWGVRRRWAVQAAVLVPVELPEPAPAVVRGHDRDCNRELDRISEERVPVAGRDCNPGRAPASALAWVVAPQRNPVVVPALVRVRESGPAKVLAPGRVWQGAPPQVPLEQVEPEPLNCPDWVDRGLRGHEPAFRIAPQIARNQCRIAKPV
jgi:hypothetical protein